MKEPPQFSQESFGISDKKPMEEELSTPVKQLPKKRKASEIKADSDSISRAFFQPTPKQVNKFFDDVKKSAQNAKAKDTQDIEMTSTNEGT